MTIGIAMPIWSAILGSDEGSPQEVQSTAVVAWVVLAILFGRLQHTIRVSACGVHRMECPRAIVFGTETSRCVHHHSHTDHLLCKAIWRGFLQRFWNQTMPNRESEDD
jgi:hypothetical protein